MEELLKDLTRVTDVITRKIKNGEATRADMFVYREKTFEIQRELYRISTSSYTEDLVAHLRRGVYSQFQLYKL